MKVLKFSFLTVVAIGLLVTSCRKKGCTDVAAFNYDKEAQKDDGSCELPTRATLKFTHSWDGELATADDFGATNINYKTEKGDSLSITKLRYSISDVRFYKADGDSVLLDLRHLVDLEKAPTMVRIIDEKVDPIEYVGIGFIVGLTPEKNITGAYADWNDLDWGWNADLGGGYHQLQMEGNFINSGGTSIEYGYTNGSATKELGDPDEATPNHIFIKLDQVIEMKTSKIIEINMQINEWYKNPVTWDLNALHSDLAGNKAAQFIMSSNGRSAFNVGTIE